MKKLYPAIIGLALLAGAARAQLALNIHSVTNVITRPLVVTTYATNTVLVASNTSVRVDPLYIPAAQMDAIIAGVQGLGVTANRPVGSTNLQSLSIRQITTNGASLFRVDMRVTQ